MAQGALLLAFFSIRVLAQDPFQIHGYIQGRFTDQEGTQDRLEIRRARLLLSGDPFEQLSYSFQMDVVKKPILMDAFVTWKPAKVFRITAGQFKVPFSSESLLSDNLQVPIERAHVINALVPGRDLNVQARDIGAQIAGTLDFGHSRKLDYATGVFRGQTLVNAPAVHYRASSTRVVYHPFKGASVGGDWYDSFSSSTGAERQRWEVEGGYERKVLTIYSEQIWAVDNHTRRRGGYALADWRFTRHWEAMTRAEWYRQDASKPDSIYIYESGANYYWGKHVKFQADAGVRDDQTPHRLTGVVLLQTQLGF